MMMPLVVFCYIIFSVGFILNVLGWYLLQKKVVNKMNQRILLINFTSVQIFLIVLKLATMYNTFIDNSTYVTDADTSNYLEFCVYSLYWFSLLLLTLDGLFHILLKTLYEKYFTVFKTKMVAAAVWMLSLPLLLLVHYANPILICLGYIVTIYSIITYSCIALLLKPQHILTQQNLRYLKTMSFRKQYLIPFLILINCAVSLMVPFNICYYSTCSNSGRINGLLIMAISTAINPLIYICFNSSLRKEALDTIGKFSRRKVAPSPHDFSTESIEFSIIRHNVPVRSFGANKNGKI